MEDEQLEDEQRAFKRFDLSGVLPNGLMQIILINVVFPYMVYQFIIPRATDLQALLIVTVFPLVGIIYGLRQQHRLDVMGIGALLFIVIMAGTTFMIGDPRILWVRYALVIGVFGLALLCSMFLPRPVWFWVDRYFSNYSTKQYFIQQHSPYYHAMLVRVGLVWGLSQVIAAAILILLSRIVTPGTYIELSSYTLYALVGFYIVLGVITLRYKGYILAKYADTPGDETMSQPVKIDR